MQRKQLVALLIIIFSFMIPNVGAVYTASFTDTIWQVPTMKADQYYVGTDTLATYINNIAGGTTVTTQASAYGYIISKTGGTYYANSTTGSTNYSGATAATVINAAIDDLDNGGIYFKAATYTITATIYIAWNQNIMIRGDGQRAVILDSSGAPGVTTILDVGDGTDVMYGWSIADIGFKGVTGTTQCIRISNSRSATVERCYFTQYKYGVFFDGTLGAFHQNYAHAVRDCTMNGPNPATSTAGIYLSGFDNSWKETTTEIRNCYILYNLAGIKASYTSQLSVIGGSLEWNGIGLDIYTYSNRGKFYSLNCESNSSWDIRIQGAGDDCDYNMFYACDLWTVGKYLSDGGFGNTFNDCANAP